MWHLRMAQTKRLQQRVAGAAAVVTETRKERPHRQGPRNQPKKQSRSKRGKSCRNHSRPRARTLMGSSQQVAAARFLNGAAATSESGGVCVSRVDEFWRP